MTQNFNSRLSLACGKTDYSANPLTLLQLEEIKARRGLRVEDGTLEPSKPLAEILREAKEKKEQEFQDKWKQMKQARTYCCTYALR